MWLEENHLHVVPRRPAGQSTPTVGDLWYECESVEENSLQCWMRISLLWPALKGPAEKMNIFVGNDSVEMESIECQVEFGSNLAAPISTNLCVLLSLNNSIMYSVEIM